ncbi:hypothetical protein KF913_16565 [Candidatus Obscuribacterales bacterium]|nr:hypothetical protein [Candidatus Obscuribacterales bacterium]
MSGNRDGFNAFIDAGAKRRVKKRPETSGTSLEDKPRNVEQQMDCCRVRQREIVESLIDLLSKPGWQTRRDLRPRTQVT